MANGSQNHSGITRFGLQNVSTFDQEHVIIDLVRSKKAAPASFGIMLAIGTLLILLGIVVNVAICVVMLRGKRFKKNNSNFFILHLSVTELVIRLLIFPVVMYSLITTSEMGILQCKLLTLLTTSFGSAIFVSLLAIAFDRYQNIANPMMTLKSRRKPVQTIFLVWLYAVIVSVPTVIGVKSIPIQDIPEGNGMVCETCRWNICDIPQDTLGRFSTVWYFAFAYFAPLVIILTFYTKVAIVLYHRDTNGTLHKVAARSKYKAMRMLVITVAGYVFSFGPDVLLDIMRSFGVFDGASFGVVSTFTVTAELLVYTSSLLNPLIFAYYNRAFRNELQRFLCK
ncbi:neuropeptide FF receptor 2-like [Montipora foliosa]|uniref:neuropeptide FF receptor 2-like n=1 Tax=Montipora foliosa TaxID=591990 RepID=UPI0035F17749